ncbi:hypothetical protein ACOSQ3_032343 [Xanthoceras sorbifolium]
MQEKQIFSSKSLNVNKCMNNLSNDAFKVYHRHCLSVFVISHHNDRFVVLSVLKQRPSPASSVPSPKTYTTSFGGVFSSVSRCYLDD